MKKILLLLLFPFLCFGSIKRITTNEAYNKNSSKNFGYYSGTSGQVLTSNGVGSAATFQNAPVPVFTSYVLAYLSADQLNLVHSTDTKILFDTEVTDLNSEFAIGTFTAKSAGYYLILGCITYINLEANVRYCARIYLNGATHLTYIYHASNTNAMGVSFIGVIHLNGTTDYIDIYALALTAGDTVDVDGAADLKTFVNIVKLGT